MKNRIWLFILLSGLTGCGKFLDAKPDKKLVVVSSLNDAQALLDDNQLMNLTGPCLGEISADNYYIVESRFNAMPTVQDRNMYLWESNVFDGTFYPTDWKNPYAVVYNANTVMETLEKIDVNSSNKTQWENIKGAALLYRAKAFQDLVFEFAKAYNPTTSSIDPGIPLRLNSNFNEVSTRATVYNSYQQIISDLKASVSLLPITAAHKMRPCRTAAFALLARTYLSMGNYSEAFLYADSCLKLNNALMDFNELDSTRLSPIASFNEEVIMHFCLSLATPLSRISVDSILFRSYSVDDLRKPIFFTFQSRWGTYNFKGSYDQNGFMFTGIATDEMWLTRAECNARTGKINAAMDDLNHLMKKRWRNGSFVPFTATTDEQALAIILTERRKELVFRNLRWIDIKRLNQEGSGISPTRLINGTIYKLSPNDNKFALPIPQEVINLTDMPQNAR